MNDATLPPSPVPESMKEPKTNKTRRVILARVKEPPSKNIPQVDIEEMDYATLAQQILAPEVKEDAIQVMDGQANHTMEFFHAKSAEGVHQLINFIEENNYQDKKPWSIAYDLYRCLVALGTK